MEENPFFYFPCNMFRIMNVTEEAKQRQSTALAPSLTSKRVSQNKHWINACTQRLEIVKGNHCSLQILDRL